MRQGASTSASSQQPPGRQQPAARGDKRLRSWDVDVSLDELVEWDALEQFMSDMPGADPSSRPSSGVPRIGSSDYSLGAHGARLPSLGPMGCLGGVQRSISSDSVGQALGLSSSSSTQQQQNGGLVPGVWPMPGGFGNGAPPGLGGLPRLPAAGSGNAASLAQSLYATWTQPTAFPLQALPMERGVSWGAELLPFMDVGDASGLVNPAIGSRSPNSAETQQPPPLLAGTPIDPLGGAGLVGASEGDSPAGQRAGANAGVQKQRFVWTSELHRRFEAAVNTLGVDQAKPQVRAAHGPGSRGRVWAEGRWGWGVRGATTARARPPHDVPLTTSCVLCSLLRRRFPS